MGGEYPISFMALDAYARRYGIEGEAFENFIAFVRAIDFEWIAISAERAARDADSKDKTSEQRRDA